LISTTTITTTVVSFTTIVQGSGSTTSQGQASSSAVKLDADPVGVAFDSANGMTYAVDANERVLGAVESLLSM
jgi:hypothetical protein